MRKVLSVLLILFLFVSFAFAAKAKKNDTKKQGLSSATFSGLKFRSIGPAFASGRIADFAEIGRAHV